MRFPFASLVLKTLLTRIFVFRKTQSSWTQYKDFYLHSSVCSFSVAQPELLTWLSCSAFSFSQSFRNFWDESLLEGKTVLLRGRHMKTISPDSYNLPWALHFSSMVDIIFSLDIYNICSCFMAISQFCWGRTGSASTQGYNALDRKVSLSIHVAFTESITMVQDFFCIHLGCVAILKHHLRLVSHHYYTK